jgi:hypothetical protein
MAYRAIYRVATTFFLLIIFFSAISCFNQATRDSNTNSSRDQKDLYLSYFKNGNIEKIYENLITSPNDIRLKIGRIPSRGERDEFKYKLTNVSNKPLYIFQLQLNNVGNYYAYNGQTWIDYRLEMTPEFSSSLTILMPNEAISENILLKERIRDDANIRISYMVPKQLVFTDGVIRIKTAQTLLIYELVNNKDNEENVTDTER